MWIIDRLRGDTRTLTPQQAWGRGLDWSATYSATGMNIDLDRAMTLPAFQRCVNLYVDDISQLPWDVFRRVGTGDSERRVPIDPPTWMVRPTEDPDYTWHDHISDVVFSLVTDRNAFLRCLPTRFDPVIIEVLDPQEVVVRDDRYGRGRVYTLRGGVEIDPLTLVHIRAPKAPGKLRATSRVTMLANTIALGLAAEEYGARFFGNGSSMSGIVEVPVGTTVDPDKMRDQMQLKHQGLRNSHAIGVLTGGATFKQTQSTARDSQLLELHESVIEDVARGFGVPPYLAGSTSPGAVAYASTSNARVDYVVHSAVGLISRMERAYSTLIPGADTGTKANLNALLRGDQASRFTAYGVALSNQFVTKDEVRRLEDWGPADEALGVESEHGGYLETPNNNAPGETPAPEKPAERAEPVNVTVHTPPVSVSVPSDDTEFVRAADLMVTDTRERLAMMEVTVAESSQRTADYVDARLAQVESRLAEAETQRQADVERLAAIPAITREVAQRDDHGRPLKVIEQRGDRTIHKLVQRDESGRIVKVTEVAA